MLKKKQHRRPHHTTNRLRMLRAAKRLSQTEVAHRLGFPTKFRLWAIENELQQPTDKERKKLAKIFGCSESDIFPALIAAA